MTVSAKVIDFYKNFSLPSVLPSDIVVHNPYDDPMRQKAIESFYKKFFADDEPRVHLIGINPSRITETSSGINYTDGFALENFCGITNDFSKSRELTSEFFYMVVEEFGSAENFYKEIFAWAMMPFSVTRVSKYKNYYEDDVFDHLIDMVQSNIQWISNLPKKGKVVIIGTGENKKMFESLPGSPFGYDNVQFLPHPRWIMQYKRAYVKNYVQQYVEFLG